MAKMACAEIIEDWDYSSSLEHDRKWIVGSRKRSRFSMIGLSTRFLNSTQRDKTLKYIPLIPLTKHSQDCKEPWWRLGIYAMTIIQPLLPCPQL